MNAQEQAYINGFVKRAAEYGLGYSEALNLLKSAEKPGLWANIRAKRARGEKPAKPGSEDYPDKKQWSKLTKDAAESAAWQRSEGKNPEGGLNAKGRASYKAQTGGTLKAPVTEDKPKGERAKRQNSFCSRMCGMKRVNTGAKAKSDPDSRINKSLRKWNCKCGEAHDSFLAKLGCVIKESRCWEGYEPVPGKEPYSEDSCRPKNSKKEKKNEKSAAPVMRLPAAKPTAHRNQVAPMKTQSKMIAPIKASPEMPYAETRANLEDLASFPISEDDFLKGGGKLMFQDPVKTPAAVPTVAQQ